MTLSNLGAAPAFQDHAQGILGEFSTPAGKVAYLMTKARLGPDATDPERRLTRHLVPVREVLSSGDLDFNQLLQRDLDDHRVAVNLVPYLMNQDWTGPAFFPPIVAVALPFSAQQPSEFPEFDAPTQTTAEALPWRQQDAGQHLRVRRLLNDVGDLNPVALGQLWWNSEFCRIVVIDGQHRAMALLAIDRTIRKSWEGGTGGRYRYFYEARINELLKSQPINDIEVPVTLLWFPELFGPGKQPHKAARKLFVDVNKEARTPSESRLILLSDGELLNILTRTTLTQLRNQSDNEYLPLYCVEYDNPGTKTTQSARWSALTNIHALKEMVNRAVFGPSKYVNEVDVTIGSREPEELRNSFMREQLDVKSLFPPAIIDGDVSFSRDDLGNKNFPESAVGILTERYQKTWGSALLALLSKIEPWAAHSRALSQVRETWLADDAIAILASEALFSGVGMYWTLRDSATHWQDEPPATRSPKPDVVKAWDMIAEKQSEFEHLRANQFLGNRKRRDHANQVYQAMNTHACQLGVALTLATVFRKARSGETSVDKLAVKLADGINKWMLSKTTGDYDRRLALAKRRDDFPKHALNVVANMDTPRAVQFRYFWLEILMSPQSLDEIGDIVDGNALRSLRDVARRAYINYVAGEKSRALRTSHPELTETQRKQQGLEDAFKEVRQALIKWFDITASEVDDWIKSDAGATSAEAVDEMQDSDQEVDDVPESEDASADADAASLPGETGVSGDENGE
ncbi:hypothetical protein A5746_21705 [Mycolicibacterium conceptionense]|uniref:DNA sulfur modification protein DndB n=1 Tax=Mycobacteriaceae TaxID=1762 RepID=UPI00096ECB9A|nr:MULTISPECIES: DNA sulfur modification protein DndB [Mycobacteriaceae]OMB89904.1 hypothetical protein A5746_21705 [Mycolicibacterium conceptionense]SKK26740.1 DGQHR domain [Mycobacteroides abscessus subsp. massiliense]